MITPQQILEKNKIFVEAPAGHGKTHTIVQCLNLCNERQLVLTHTHAGIASIKQKMKDLGGNSNLHHIETIAGLVLRYSKHFLPQVKLYDNKGKPKYPELTKTMAEYIKLHPMQALINCSYAGVFVDEYQDCSIDQHNFIMELSRKIPLKIFGDPLQAIFKFNGTPVSFTEDIPSDFYRSELVTPHRWTKYNQKLGLWLKNTREQIKQKAYLSKTDCCVESIIWEVCQEYNFSKKLEIIKNIDTEGSIVIISPDPKKKLAPITNLAKALPEYQVIEAYDNTALLEYANKFDLNKDFVLFTNICEFIGDSLTKASVLKDLSTNFRQGKFPNGKKPEIIKISELFKNFIQEEALYKYNLLELLEKIKKLIGGRAWRKDLFYLMLSAIKKAINDKSTIEAAVIKNREAARSLGRKSGDKCITNNLLCKGLEFDYVVVLDLQNIKDKENLYVALSRARKKVIIISNKDYWTGQ